MTTRRGRVLYAVFALLGAVAVVFAVRPSVQNPTVAAGARPVVRLQDAAPHSFEGGAPASATLEDPAGSLGTLETRQTPEERKRAVVERHEQRIRSHRAEPLDRPWAARTERMLKRDLAPAARAAAFQFTDVGCRTNTCLVAVAWDSLERARSAWRQLLHQPVRPLCSRAVLVADAPAADGKTHGTAVFDCTAWHEAGSPDQKLPAPLPATRATGR